jgi:hypothetical protein
MMTAPTTEAFSAANFHLSSASAFFWSAFFFVAFFTLDASVRLAMRFSWNRAWHSCSWANFSARFLE